MDSSAFSSAESLEEQHKDQRGGDIDTEEWLTSDCDEPEAVLCRRCKNIDFGKAFESNAIIDELNKGKCNYHGRKSNYHGMFIANVNWYSRSCALCRTLEKTIQDCYGSLDHKFVVRAFADPAFYDPHRPPPPLHEEYLRGVFWILPVPSPQSSITWSLGHIFFKMDDMGWLSCCLTEGRLSMRQPRRISPYLDIKLAHGWIAGCQRFHSSKCNEIVGCVPHLALIDCETLQISHFSSQPPMYLALSYVWAPQTTETLSSSGNFSSYASIDLPPWSSLALVIQDAIIVTRDLGFQYLWIDKYCIAQNDPRKKHAQIEAMHLIYGAAAVTLIAASGSDEHHGLPGVQRARKSNHLTNVRGTSLFRQPPSYAALTSRSHWATRGWTLQEEYFSRRKIYFFEEYTVFECPLVSCSEAFEGLEAANTSEEAELYSVHMPSDKAISERYSGKPSFGEQLDDLQERISLYTRRNLTYAADSLRAFGGVQKSFEGGAFPVYCLRGLPMCFSEEAVGDIMDEQLAYSLCWEHEDPTQSKRRREFPSWSWAGWAGFMEWAEILNLQMLGGCPKEFVLADEEGRCMSLLDIVSSLNETGDGREQVAIPNETISPRTTAMYFLTNTTALSFEAITVGKESFSNVCPHFWEHGKVFGLHFPRFGHGYEEKMPFTAQFLIDGIADGNLGCVLLGIFASRVKGWTQAHLLLVSWYDVGGIKHARRVGKVTVASAPGEDVDVLHILQDAKYQHIRLS